MSKRNNRASQSKNQIQQWINCMKRHVKRGDQNEARKLARKIKNIGGRVPSIPGYQPQQMKRR